MSQNSSKAIPEKPVLQPGPASLLCPKGLKRSPGAPTAEASGPKLRLAGWKQDSLVDGPGLRFVVFAQGCPHRCPGCHNPETHLPIGGKLRSVDELFVLYEKAPGQQGITLSGGEPFAQAEAMVALAEKVREAGGDVVAYTGYVLETLRRMAEAQSDIGRLLGSVDLLVDGPFVLAQRTLTLPFRGSRNQRILPLSERGEHLADEIRATEARFAEGY